MILVASLVLFFVAQEPPDEPWDSLFWRGGLWMQAPTGSPGARLNGRWMHDWSDLDSVWLDEPGEADQTRRLRLLLQGEWNARLAFKTQGEFKGGDPHLLEWWINWKTPDQPSLRVGHFREPFGLDARTASAHITFVERSSPTQALTFGRNRGLEVHKSGTSSSWAAGVFQESMGMADEGLLHNRALTGRVTWLPLGNAPGEALLHLGMAATYRDTQADGVRLAADPEVHLARKGADTGTIAAESVSGLVFESVWVRGALTTQAELFFANLEQSSGPHAALHGGYLQVSSMLTGEQRAYREAIHSLGRLVVSRPTLGGGGPGAWELAARYSHTDLSDGYVDGGVMNNFTLGLT